MEYPLYSIGGMANRKKHKWSFLIIRVSEELKNRVKGMAKREDRDVSNFVRWLLEKYEGEGKKPH